LQGAIYSVGRVLGQGGFGITYLGSDSGLKRAVAIKEFFPQTQGCSRVGTTVHPGGMISPVDFRMERDKFLAEGQRLARFQHPSIVKVFSLFEENNTAYMVMELLKGRTLLKIVEEDGRLDERRAVTYITQVAEALDVIHGSELLHRDVKPENIIVKEDGRAVLVDFGTAREFAAGKTRRMTTSLTPGYAPLEQYGQRARFGVFTDIYALGATLYHVVTGEMPVQATDRAAGVELPSPQKLNPTISVAVSDAVLWALEMRVQDRPQSVRDFITAITGGRSRSSIKPRAPTGVPTDPKRRQQLLTGCGLVEITVSRSGQSAIDRPLTINIERAASRVPGEFTTYKTVTVPGEHDLVSIDVAGGEYRVSASCTIFVRNQTVFATKILTSEIRTLKLAYGETARMRLHRLHDTLLLPGGDGCPT
jgi:serine/threonine protein kinase